MEEGAGASPANGAGIDNSGPSEMGKQATPLGAKEGDTSFARFRWYMRGKKRVILNEVGKPVLF